MDTSLSDTLNNNNSTSESENTSESHGSNNDTNTIAEVEDKELNGNVHDNQVPVIVTSAHSSSVNLDEISSDNAMELNETGQCTSEILNVVVKVEKDLVSIGEESEDKCKESNGSVNSTVTSKTVMENGELKRANEGVHKTITKDRITIEEDTQLKDKNADVILVEATEGSLMDYREKQNVVVIEDSSDSSPDSSSEGEDAGDNLDDREDTSTKINK